MASLSGQRGTAGTALLSAMMVVVVVAAIAIKQSWRTDLELARAGHRWAGMQAKAYVEGAEELALIALEKDLQENAYDSNNELWAAGFEFPTDHGSMQIRIVDAQGKLNVNNLAEPWVEASVQQQQRGQKYLTGPDRLKPIHASFIRLLQTVPLDDDGSIMSETEAEAIMEAVKDWVDSDNDPELATGGAEQDFYEQLDVPYIMSNGPMLSISEMRRVKGVSAQLYQALLPHIVALAPGTPTNVNTMGVNLARSLNEKGVLQPLSEVDGQAIVDELAANEVDTVTSFKSRPPVSVHSPETDHLSTSTSWFVLEATVTVGDHVRRSRSLIERTASRTRVVRRTDANF